MAAQQLVVPAGKAERLDKLVPALVEGVSRAAARRLIDAGAVFVNGQRCRVASRMIQPGARLRIETDLPQAGDGDAAVSVLFDDGECVAVNKPPGMPSAPTRQAAAGSASEWLERRWRESGVRRRLWVVHRLDAATSGVLLFATSAAAARHLSEAFRDGKIDKTYVALVSAALPESHQAWPQEGCIDLPIASDGRRARIDANGRPARTAWQLIELRRSTAVLRLLPQTGRMHQLRVHLAAIGHPIVGDHWYGGAPAKRLMLHALELRFATAPGGPPIVVSAPLPGEFQAVD